MAEQDKNNIQYEFNNATSGMNMDNAPIQIEKGQLTYALNAAVESFDGKGVSYQNELGNELCITFPEGYVLIGHHFIIEQNKHIFFLTDPSTGNSQIGYMDNNDCKYHILVEAPCLNFNTNYPIHKVVHRITNFSTEIYWTDGFNPRRYLDINNIPKIIRWGTPLCDPVYTSEIDCNQLKIQPNFSIPILNVREVNSSGNLKAGTYQFAIQYADAAGNPFTSYYSITNPLPIADPTITTPNFDYPVGKSIVVDVSNLDVTGQFRYFNIAVVQTVNNIPAVELVGTYSIDVDTKTITYTGQSSTNIRLSIDDIFEKFPYYDIADDITTAQDILIWSNLTSVDRINYQHIANAVQLEWETWRIPATESYADEVNATNLKSYMRDEVYAFEIQFILNNGKETDSFHIPGREKGYIEMTFGDVPQTNPDFVGTPERIVNGVGYSPYWKIYNTATVKGLSPLYTNSPSYKGPYQYGDFAYWESTEEYPCNKEIWGELAGQKIRHHKFPDVLVSPIFESKMYVDKQSMVMGNDAIFPIGVRVNADHIKALIDASSLTREQKDEIVGFKILRGNRSNNQSVVAKGILRNVNSYTRDETEYYFPNYPYNDLRDDPFLNSSTNAYKDDCQPFDIDITRLDFNVDKGYECAIVEYVDCANNKKATKIYTSLVDNDQICSMEKPVVIYGKGKVSYANYDVWDIAWAPEDGVMWCGGFRVQYEDITEGIVTRWVSGGFMGIGADRFQVKVVIDSIPQCVEFCDRGWPCGEVHSILFLERVITRFTCNDNNPLTDDNSLKGTTDRYRQIFNSPDTSFAKPFLGNILKLESVIYGKGQAHFMNVKDNAKYKLISKEAQKVALDSAAEIAGITDDFDASIFFTAYQSYLDISLNQITRKNYAYSFNSTASYDYTRPIPNGMGVKQRNVDIARYLSPVVIDIGDDKPINNWYRESSVYLRTELDKDALPFPDNSPSMVTGVSQFTEESRFTISQVGNCNAPEKKEDIYVVSYYASLKKDIPNQWGQIYSYETVDTGFTEIFDSTDSYVSIFGGDTFINRFAFKTKLPFFIDNRVGAPDDSDIFYDEIGNVAYPKYWHSSRSIMDNYSFSAGYSNSPGILVNIISYKAHNFDCPNNTEDIPSMVYSSGLTSTTTSTSTTTVSDGHPVGTVEKGSVERTYYDGYFYLFAYGIPNFYCESTVNVDLRQAYNNREGDFWPHVSNSIPDEWLQESFVSIANDNTYYYNTTYSKQNKENFFSHLPVDWDEDKAYTKYPFRAIYSDKQSENADNRVNTWRIYRAISYFDFPQNFGQLVSLDGIQNRAILARFENKTLLYDNLITIDTSNPKAAYIGNSLLFREGPPIDFADTDLGYIGSQHKMLLKIPNGQITADAKRGHVFLIQGTQATDLSGFGSGMNRFFTENLPFQMQKYFPGTELDNHFNGIGLHAVYDNRYDRIILTKIDYRPINENVKYDPETKSFYIEVDLIESDGNNEAMSFVSPLNRNLCVNPVITKGEINIIT